MPEIPNPRRSRSRLPKPSPPRRRDYVAASPGPGPSASPASSRHPSRSTVLKQRANAAANTARPSAPGHPVDPLNSTGNLFVGGSPDDLGGQPSPASPQPPFTWPNVGGSDLAQMSTAPRSVVQHSAYLPNPPDSTQLQQSPYESAGMFNQAHDFTVTGTFVDGNVTYNDASSNRFMKEILGKTIPGAEFDSSDRDPPPRCHPGTRLAVLARCLYFISNCDGIKKMRWVVGAAGVGKSAIMQSVAESPGLPVHYHASVFFSIGGRDDGTKAILTLCYQFAAKSDSYRQIIEQEITSDPSLLRSSMVKQFNKLIVDPFIHNNQLNSAGRVLIIIDGLDECEDHRTQKELLRLISDFCLMYPSSPLVWLIASRPEPHITSFFTKPNVIPAYEKEEIPIESDEARADVERLLREKLMEIKEESDSPNPQWPEERDIWKLANAAGGLFAYAHTVIRYVGDSTVGSPVSQLSDVLHVIDNHPMTELSREEHPMALLDALYQRILSKVPDKVMSNTRKLLLALASCWKFTLSSTRLYEDFIVLCNWLGMSPDEAYAAVNHLRSVLYVPRRDKAHEDNVKAFHKSFIDYISDFSRSRFSPDVRREARQLKAQCTLRILNEVPDGIELRGSARSFDWGDLTSVPVTCNNISLTWLVDSYIKDREMRLNIYKLAIDEVVKGLIRGDPIFQGEFSIRFLTAVFGHYHTVFPHCQLRDVVFDESRRVEFMAHGILKEIPLRAVAVPKLDDFCNVKLQFRRLATTVTNLPDPWDSSCRHEREGEWETGKIQSWTTTFRRKSPTWMPSTATDCTSCFERFKQQLENWKARSPDDIPLVLFTSTGECCVRVRLVDPEDGVSEWTYWFWCNIPWEERKKYGSTV